MKRLLIVSVLMLSTAIITFGQKYAYVDSEYILENISEYRIAQEQLDALSVEWQKEIEDKFAEVDRLYKAYQAEAVLLPEDMKRKREDEIIKKEKEAKELQKKRFGKDGDLFKKRQELVKPIQDRIYNAIEKIATEGNYGVVFDKSGSLTMLYTNPKYDKSDAVLDELGYKPGAIYKGDNSKSKSKTNTNIKTDGDVDRK
ncbi:MAG: OmpH family outer membrane protein [Bacteroidetes bacterium]|nr:OmpH family outer membrane protein [Bacteroidota bacterium]